MIELILQALNDTQANTEAIRIAKGAYKLPNTYQDTIQKIKDIWQQRKQ